MLSPMLLATSTLTLHQWLVHPSFWPTQAHLRDWCQTLDPGSAALLIITGAFSLFSGYKSHRLLIALTTAAIGGYLGAGHAERYNMFYVGMACGAVLLGLLGWYFTNLSAAALGAICGALVGSAVWQMAGLDPHFAWSGALTGAVALGLLCFIIFRVSVIIFTSLQGAIMLVLGILGMAAYYPNLRDNINNSLSNGPYLLPTMILGLALLGVSYQYLKSSGGKSGSSKKPAPATASKE